MSFKAASSRTNQAGGCYLVSESLAWTDLGHVGAVQLHVAPVRCPDLVVAVLLVTFVACVLLLLGPRLGRLPALSPCNLNKSITPLLLRSNPCSAIDLQIAECNKSGEAQRTI